MERRAAKIGARPQTKLGFLDGDGVDTDFFDGTILNYQIVIPAFGTLQGPFQLTNLEFAGEHNGEVTYDLTLESAGELTFTAM